ncbi:MAG: hypothetical protein AAB789_00575, partial [Patescibacteria group bacterium]
KKNFFPKLISLSLSNQREFNWPLLLARPYKFHISLRARKNLILVTIKNNTIPHEVIGKFSSAVILLKPAGEGKGIIAGGPVRVVVSLAGIVNVTSKILGTTTNKLNNARAAIEALKKLKK